MSKFGIGMKIVLGYVLMGVLLVVSVGSTIIQIGRTNEVTNRMITLRAPTAQCTLVLLNGMNHSLAALRGWIILGSDNFKDEREKAWSLEIETALKDLKKYSVNWTNPNNKQLLEDIETQLVDFKKYQQEIEDIAQSVDNTPAMKILFEDAAPQAEILATNITRIIDLEAKLEATPQRKAVLGMMADVRGTTGLALASIRAYLLSGDEKFKTKFDTLWAKNERRFGDLTKNVGLLTREQRQAFNAFSAARKIFDPLPPMMFSIRGGDEWNLANTWLGTKAAPTAFAIKSSLDEMLADQQQLMAVDMAEGERRSALLTKVAWIILYTGSALCIALCVFMGSLISRKLTKPINKTIEGLRSGAEEVAAASGQVSSSSQQLAEGSSEQASSLEETSASLEEVSAMSSQNAQNANQAKTMASEAGLIVEKVDKQMLELVKATGEISKSTEETGKIIKTIDEIAFQTNLLALNAAVEAARAGEAGAGFAVVADEVRNLALRAAEAAKSTASLIENTINAVNTGKEITVSTQEAFQENAEISGKIGKLVEEIASASNEQALGLEQVNIALAEMDKVTQATAASAEESAAASEELSAQAIEVKSSVAILSNIVGGDDAYNNAASDYGYSSGRDVTVMTDRGGYSKQNVRGYLN